MDETASAAANAANDAVAAEGQPQRLLKEGL